MSVARLMLVIVLAGAVMSQRAPGVAAEPLPPPPAWQITCVDCPKWFGGLTDRSLRLDAAGNPHVAYGGDHLYYARYDGIAWRYETADPAPVVGAPASLALNAAGWPAISYFDGLNQDLKFAVRGPAGWHTSTVDTGGVGGAVGGASALALDAQGRPHIAYVDSTRQTVKYASRGPTGWRIEQIGAIHRPSTAISLALDGAGQPHVSYFAYDPGTASTSLIYAWRDAAGWRVQTIAADVSQPSSCSLALDGDGQPAVAYPDGGQQSALARWTGAAWQIEPVAWDGDSPDGLSLAFDAAGFPHLSAVVVMQYEPTAWAVQYQYQDSTGWQPTGGFGRSAGQTSLALDAAGRPLIAQSPGDVLAVSRYDGVSWRSQGVDVSMDVGAFSSLALDGSGRPIVAYAPGLVAAWGGVGWTYDTFFRAYGQPTGVSLALTSEGQPAVAYSWYWSLEIFEETGLDYVVRGPAGWTREALYQDDGSARAGPPALALDASGMPQVSNAFSVVETWPPGGPPYVVRHFQRAPSGWTGDTVDEFYDAPPQPVAMRLDAQGDPVIAYTTPDGSAVKLARRTEGGWLVEVVDPAGGRDVALALDAAGSPRLSYASLTGPLKYAARAASGWQIETVAAGAFVQTSLAIDAAGYAHISAYDAANADLVYARQSPAGWRADVVVDRGDVGRGSSLALTAAGRPLISFYDATTRDLMLAVQRTGPPAPRASYLPLILRR